MKQLLKNIGPVSWRGFERVGIKDVETLKRMGAAMVYVVVEEDQGLGKVSLNLLYALAAGLTDRHWQEVGPDEKGQLLRDVENLRESRSHLGT